MTENITAIVALVAVLNDEIEKATEGTGMILRPFIAEFDGEYQRITYNDHELWNSNEDLRDNEEQYYGLTSLDAFVREAANGVNVTLRKLKVKPKSSKLFLQDWAGK